MINNYVSQEIYDFYDFAAFIFTIVAPPLAMVWEKHLKHLARQR